MSTQPSQGDPEKLPARQAAKHIGLSPATLAKLRCWGGGPEYLKLGRRVMYERHVLDAWVDRRRARNTSDAARLPTRLTDELAA
jgi:hypothetical protein